jgi:hypothetical protein
MSRPSRDIEHAIDLLQDALSEVETLQREVQSVEECPVKIPDDYLPDPRNAAEAINNMPCIDQEKWIADFHERLAPHLKVAISIHALI